jgi:hypothetical protein
MRGGCDGTQWTLAASEIDNYQHHLLFEYSQDIITAEECVVGISFPITEVYRGTTVFREQDGIANLYAGDRFVWLSWSYRDYFSSVASSLSTGRQDDASRCLGFSGDALDQHTIEQWLQLLDGKLHMTNVQRQVKDTQVRIQVPNTTGKTTKTTHKRGIDRESTIRTILIAR